jgi:hypothetical protein
MRVRVHGGAIAHVRNWDEIVRTLTAEELAHVRATSEALVAAAALRSPRHADAITHLDATNVGPTASTMPTPPCPCISAI